jgi:hypothetical protein
VSGPLTYVPNTSGLKAGNMDGVEKDAQGKFTSTRSERGRKHALEILEDPKYREKLMERMRLGDAGPIEVWIWRIGYGDPPRARDDDDGDAERFERMRVRLREFMKRHPDEARELRRAIAKGLAEDKALPPPADEDR